jgi:hypothetical protein
MIILVSVTVDNPQTAEINSLNTTLMNVKRSDGRLLYEFNADAFSNFQSIWVNRKDYNYFLIYFEALFNPEIPFPPSYIREHGMGIVSTYARVVQSKIGRAGGTDLFHLSIHPLIHPSIHPSIHPLIYPSP